MKLETGSRVQDWRLVERLGAGAFGEVWKAAHVHLPRVAAIKFATAEGAAAALERQGVAQFGLDHPGIVKVLDASLSADPPYIVLECVDGMSLRQLLRERGRFEIQDVSAILRQLVSVLRFAHERGVVHGDLKPENILVVEHGVEKLVKVTDFQLGGFAGGDRPLGAAGPDGVRPSLRTAGPRGTYRYIAPEQELDQPIDGRADLFALGVVLFEMATGTLPQGRDLPSDVNPALSWWWDHIFSRCYTGKERRYRSAEEVARDLAVAATGPTWGEMPSQKEGLATSTSTSTSRRPGEARVTLLEVPAEDLAELGLKPEGCCAPVGRGSALPALVVAFLALLIPAAVIHSVAGLERCGGPYAAKRARGAATAPAAWRQPMTAAIDATDLQLQFILARKLLDDASSPGERAYAQQKVDWTRAEATQHGYFIAEDGKIIRMDGRR